MAGLTGTEVLYKRENNMGVTTLTFRKRRYMYPEVIVKGEHDLSHSASTGDLENKGMCVMLDVGMFCPHCSGAISARLSGSRSKLIISKQNPHAVPLQSRHSLELEYSHPPIQEISFDKPEGGEEPVSSMQAATGPPSKHAKIKKIKTEQHGRMEETQLQMTLDCESPVSAHSHTYSPGKLEGIDKMSSSDYASLDRDSRFSSFGSTANSTETCVSVTGTGGIMTTKSDEAYNSMASSSHRPNNKVKPKVPPKPSLYRMPPLGSKYSSLPRDVHLSPINDTSADEKLILDSMQVDVSDTNEEVLVDELLSDEIIDEEYQNLVNGYKARNIRSNNLPKGINNDGEDTILHKQNNEYQSDKDVDIFSEKTDMNLEQSSGNISERSTSPELLVDDVLENMESEIFSGDVTLPRVFAIQKERRKKNNENKKKMKHIVDQHSKVSSYETNTNDQTGSRNTESNKVNKKQTASAPSTLQRKALRERVKAKYKNIVAVPDPNLPSQLKPGFSHEDFFEDVLEALTDLEEESISDWTSDYDSEGKDLHLSTPDSEGHGYESGDMKVTLDNYGMNRHKTNTSSLECIADDRSHDLDSSLERLHSAGIPSSLDDGGSSSEGSLSGHDVSPKEQNGMLFKQLIQNTRHLTDELLTSTEEDHRDGTRECLSPGREQFDLMDEVFVDNPSEPMQERTAQTAVLEYPKHGTYTSSETNESSISVSHVPVIQQDSMTEDMPPINTPLKRRPRSDGDDSVLSEDIDSSLENLLSSNAMHASTSDLDEPLSIELHNSGYDNNEDVNDSETIITKDFEKCLHTDTTEVDEFVPETDEYAARPEVLKHAHDAARYIASFLGNHNITKFDKKKLSTNDDSSEKPNNNQAAFDSAVANGEWKDTVSERETKVASFDSKENITKEQAKQLMKYVLDKSSHIHHSKEHTTDLDACLDEVCQTCEFKPTGEKDIVKNEEVTTQEVTLVFKWPKKKSKRFGNEMPTIIPSIPRELPPPALKPKPQQPFRTIHLRRVMRVSDFDVEVLEGPTMATIEYSKDGSTKKTIQQGPVKKAVTESSDTKVEESPSNDSIETAQLDTLSGFETENEIETENISTTSHVVVKDNDQSCETEMQQNVLVQGAEHDYEDQEASQEVSSLNQGYSRLQGTVSDTNVSKVSEEIYTGRKSRSDVQVSQFMETDIDAVDESSELNRLVLDNPSLEHGMVSKPCNIAKTKDQILLPMNLTVSKKWNHDQQLSVDVPATVSSKLLKTVSPSKKTNFMQLPKRVSLTCPVHSKHALISSNPSNHKIVPATLSKIPEMNENMSQDVLEQCNQYDVDPRLNKYLFGKPMRKSKMRTKPSGQTFCLSHAEKIDPFWNKFLFPSQSEEKLQTRESRRFVDFPLTDHKSKYQPPKPVGSFYDKFLFGGPSEDVKPGVRNKLKQNTTSFQTVSHAEDHTFQIDDEHDLFWNKFLYPSKVKVNQTEKTDLQYKVKDDVPLYVGRGVSHKGVQSDISCDEPNQKEIKMSMKINKYFRKKSHFKPKCLPRRFRPCVQSRRYMAPRKTMKENHSVKITSLSSRQNLHKEGKDVSDARFIDQNERNVYLLNLSQYFVPQTMSSKDIPSTDTSTVAQENAMSLLSESSVCPKCNEEYTYEEMTMDDSGTKLQYLPYKFRRFGHPMPCERCLRLEREIKEKLVELTSIVEDMNKRKQSLSEDKWTTTDNTEGYSDSDNLESDLTNGYNMYKDNSMIQEDIAEQHLHSEIQSTEVKTEHKRTVQNLDLGKSGSGELSLPWLENALQMDFELDKPYTLDKYADNLSKYIMFRAKLYFVLENTSTLPPNKLPGFDVMGRTELRARGVDNITGSVSKSLDSVGNGSISVHDEVMGFGDKDLAQNTKFIGSNVASTDESCNVGLSNSVFALHDNGTLVDKNNMTCEKTVPDHVSRGVQTDNQIIDNRNPKNDMHVTNSRHISNEVKSVVNRVFSMLVPEHIHSNVNNENTKSMQPDVLEPNAHVHSSLHDAPSNTHAHEHHSIPTINLPKIRNEASDEVKSLEHNVSSSPDIQISDCQVCNVSSIGSSDSLNIPNAEIELTMSDGKEQSNDHAGSFEDVTVCADGESNDKIDLGGKDKKYSTEQKNLNEVGGKHAKLVNNHQLPNSLHPDDMKDQRITEGISQFRDLESFRNRARHEALLQAKLEQNMKEIQDELAMFKKHMPPTEQDMKPSIPQVSQEVKSVVNQALSFLLGDSSTTQRSSENSESPKENENMKHREISIEPESSLEEGPSIASNQPVPHGPDSEEYSCQASAPLLQVVNKNEDNSFSIDAEYTLNIPANNPSVEIESTNSDGNEHSNENVTVSFEDVTSTVCADGESNNKLSLVGKDEESSIEQKNMNEMGIKRAEMVNNHQLPTSLPSDDMEDQRSMGGISKLGDLESFRNRVRHEALLQTKLEQNMKEIQDELAELKKHMPPTEQDMKPSIPQLSQEVKSAVNQAFSFLLGDSSTTQRSSENSESPKENENMKHREISTEPEISVEEDSSLASNEPSTRKPDSEEHCCQALTHSLGAVNGNRDNSVDMHSGFLEMDHSNTDIAIEHHVAVTSGVSTGPLPDLLVDQGITDRDARSYGPLSLKGLRPMHINHMGYQLDQQISCSMDLESGMATEHNLANMDIDETDSVCVGETNIGIAGEPNIEILDIDKIDINPVEEETMPGSSHLCIKKHLPANTVDQKQCSESILLADYCPIELSGKGSQETITDSHLILVDHDDGIKVTDSLLEFDSPSLTAPIEDSDDETFDSFLEFDYIGSSSSSEGEYCLYSREAYSPAEFEQGMKVEDELLENETGDNEFDDDDSEREVETQMEDQSDHLSDMCMAQDSRQDEISSPFDKKTNITISVDDLLGNVNENMDNDDTFGEPLHSMNHKTYSAGSEVQVDSRMVSQAIQDPEDRREPTHGNVIVKSKREKKDAKLVKRIIADLDVYNYGIYLDDSSSSSISDDMSSLASSEFSDASGLTVIHIPCSSDKSESDGGDTPNKVVDMARLIQEQAEGMTNAPIPREFHHLQNTSDFNNGKELDDLEQVWIKRQQCTEPLSKSYVRKGIHDYKGGSFAAMNYKRPESCCLPLSISSEAIKQKVQPTSSHKSSISSSDSALLRQNLHVDLRVSELDERQQNQQEAKHFIEQKSQVAEGLSEKQHDMCQRLQLLKADFDRMLADVKQVKDQFIQTHEKHKQSVSSLHEFALQAYESDPVASGVARSRAWLQQHTLPLPEYKEIHKSHSCDAIRNRKKAPNFELGESSSDPVLRTHASTPESSVIGVPQPKKSTCQLLPCLGSSQNDNSDEDEHMTSIPTISEDDESIADDKNLEDTRESVYTSLSGSSDRECNGSDEIPPRPVSRLSFNHKASRNPWIDDNDDSTPYRRWSETDIEYIRPVLDKDPDKLRADLEERMSRALAHVEQSKPIDRTKSPDCSDESAEQSSIPQGNFSKHVQLYAPYFHYRKSRLEQHRRAQILISPPNEQETSSSDIRTDRSTSTSPVHSRQHHRSLSGTRKTRTSKKYLV